MTISPEILNKIANLTAEQEADLKIYLSKFNDKKEIENKSDKKN